jgi:sugar O-acyltransferase (sialic acid O-acetyltransferase NeuD family)
VTEIFVAGTRSFSAEVVGYAREAGFQVVGLLEPADRERAGRTIHELPVTWLEDAEPAGRAVVVGTGDAARREIVERLLGAGFALFPLVHPRAHLAETSTVGAGALVGPGVVVGADSVVGEHVVVGRGTLIGHHTELGAFATLGPGANVAGNARIGLDVFVGMGAVIRDHVTIGDGAEVAMGAVVVGNVPAGASVRGVPARAVRTRNGPH